MTEYLTYTAQYNVDALLAVVLHLPTLVRHHFAR